MKSFNSSILYTSTSSSSSGYAYDKLEVRKNSLFELSATLGIFFNNDSFDTDCIASVAILNTNTNQWVYILNLNASTGTAGDIQNTNNTQKSFIVLEAGSYEVHYGFRKLNPSYIATLHIILEKLLENF